MADSRPLPPGWISQWDSTYNTSSFRLAPSLQCELDPALSLPFLPSLLAFTSPFLSCSAFYVNPSVNPPTTSWIQSVFPSPLASIERSTRARWIPWRRLADYRSLSFSSLALSISSPSTQLLQVLLLLSGATTSPSTVRRRPRDPHIKR